MKCAGQLGQANTCTGAGAANLGTRACYKFCYIHIFQAWESSLETVGRKKEGGNKNTTFCVIFKILKKRHIGKDA